jgi:hypothetical protein
MPSPRDVSSKATRESRAKGGQARAEKIRAQKEEERALLSEMRRGALDAAVEKLSELAERATATIALLLDGESEAVRARVAFGVLEVLDAAELREMSDRLSRLEEIAAGRNGKP